MVGRGLKYILLPTVSLDDAGRDNIFVSAVLGHGIAAGLCDCRPVAQAEQDGRLLCNSSFLTQRGNYQEPAPGAKRRFDPNA